MCRAVYADLVRDEDKAFSSSVTAQRRAEQQKKAEERAKEESVRLRKVAAEQRESQVGRVAGWAWQGGVPSKMWQVMKTKER